MNFKSKVAQLVAGIKGIKTFNHKERVKTIAKDIPALIALAGGTFMFMGAFLPYVTFLGETLRCSIAYSFGWFIFMLTLGILGLAYFKQTFWAGLASGVCLNITFIQGLLIGGNYLLKTSVGFWFILIGELALAGAFVLETFVFNKDESAAPNVINVEATPVENNTTTE